MHSRQTVNINITRSSTFAYLDYRNRMQSRLANLNNNVSSMIKESFSGIDDICQRVRECLHTANVPERQKVVSFSEETTEYEIVEERSKSGDETTAHDNDVITDFSDEKLDNREDNPPTEECSDKIANEYVNIISCNDKGDSNINEFNEKPYVEEDITPPLSEVESMTEGKFNVLEKFKETVLTNVVNTYYDDFDVMDKIIENINEEIKDFSQATISGRIDTTDPSEHKARIKRPILNPRFKKPPPIRRPSTTDPSRFRNLNAGTILSENEFDCLLYNKKPDEPFLMPDVYRKRAFTDLYQRLMLQLEANDSLILFQKLMNKNKNRHKKMQKSFYNPNSKLLDIPIMNYYPKKSKSIPNIQDPSKKTELSKKYNDSLWFSHFKGKNAVKTRTSRRNMRKKTERQRGGKTPINYSDKSCIQKRKTKRPASNNTSTRSSIVGSMSSEDSKRCPVECPCKMVVHNDRPLAPSTKCRLHWMRAKTSLAPTRKLEFLDILDDLTNRDLLPLQSEYPRRDNQPSEQDQKDVHTTYLYQLMYGKQGTKNVWKQLLEPTIECAHKGCKICRPTSKETPDKLPEKGNNKYSRSEILKKLSPYMHDPERKERYYQALTVMPVHVYYDSYKQPESPTKLTNQRNNASPKKLPAFKEIKGVKRAEWTLPANTKPMKVVFDSLPKRMEVLPLPLQPTKPTTNSARITTDKSILKTSTSKSFSPKSFSTFCRNPGLQQPMSPIRVDVKELSKFAKIQKDLEKIKSESLSSNLNDTEKKLWANKYQKTIGQQLVSFVERQEPIAPPVVPKHAAPKYKDPTAHEYALSSAKDMNPQKMLNNLEGLKQKNSVIQNNIQKAIGVIESKMVDILSAEGDSPNVEAFDVMEREITDVLSLMKSNKKKTGKATSAKNLTKDGVNTETSLEEEVSTISNELFKKLEKILDSERSLHSTRSGQTDISIRCKRASKSEEKLRKMLKKDDGKQAPKKEEGKQTPKKVEAKKHGLLHGSKKAKWDTKIQSLTKSSARNDNSSEDSCTPVKLNAYSATNRANRFNANKSGKKSKLSTPSGAKSPTQSPTKTWNNILSMPCGDQNTEKTKTQGITHSEHLTKQADTLAEQQPSQVYDNLILAKSQGDGALKSHDVAQKSTDDESSLKASKKVRFEEFLNEDPNTGKSEDNSLALAPSKDDNSSNYYTPNQSPKAHQNDQDGNSDFVDQVNRIIKRVEDIYTQLDDMHNSSSEENVKKFQDPVPEVRSEQFLTPFMQAVKEKRKTPEKSGPQKSPSYYNVINFLDSLKDMQDDRPIETHTARLCYHVNVYHQPMVFNQAKIEHTAELLPIVPAKTSCIKKLQEEQNEDQKFKSKKVHFLVEKVDKSNQVTVCNFHKKKILRISSQQFPAPEDKVDENTKRQEHCVHDTKSNEKDQNIIEQYNMDKEKKDVEQCNMNITQSSDSQNKENADKTKEMAQKSDDVNLEILNIINKIEALSEETKKEIASEEMNITAENEKPVQVYCHTITEEQDEFDINDIKEVESYDKQMNISASKTDRSNQSMCQNPKENTDESIKAVNTDLSYNAIGVNTDDMDTSQSVQNCSNETSLISLLYDGTPEMVCPKVIKERIDISEGNYSENPILQSSSLQKLKQNKIVVFREISGVPNLLRSMKDLNLPAKLSRRRLEKRRGLRLMRKTNLEPIKIPKDIQSWGENIVLLKSFYAIVYILMFTALSMDYRCM